MFSKIGLTTLLLFFLISCGGNKDKSKDNTRAESTIRNDIIERSGTMLTAGSDPKDKKLQLDDAQNRLRTGGGLFGKKASNLLDLGKNKSDTNTASVGFPINPYLWKGSLETISFMPLTSADPFGGIIITDWYAEQNESDQRCKINIFIKGVELKTENLKVNSFCQKLNEKNVWIDQKINQENNIKLENAILNKAKKIRLSQS
tara:strand:+ start:1542 stop:2150 length:609 start_codon:yes stop_codon:yes gene_type:complete